MTEWNTAPVPYVGSTELPPDTSTTTVTSTTDASSSSSANPARAGLPEMPSWWAMTEENYDSVLALRGWEARGMPASHYIFDKYYRFQAQISSWARHRGIPTVGSMLVFLAMCEDDPNTQDQLIEELEPWAWQPMERSPRPPPSPGTPD